MDLSESIVIFVLFTTRKANDGAAGIPYSYNTLKGLNMGNSCFLAARERVLEFGSHNLDHLMYDHQTLPIAVRSS